MAWDTEAERLLIANACRENFWWFVLEAYGVAFSPGARKKFSEDVHKPFCLWFDKQVKDWEIERKQEMRKHLMVILPREFWKTSIFTQAGQLWLHVRDPEISTYLGSETVSQAITWLKPIKAVIVAGGDPYARFTWLFGNWFAPERTWKSEEFVHAARRSGTRKEPSFGTWGVSTGITGSHVDALFFDDPISYEAIQSDAQWFDKVNEHVASLNYILQSDGLMVWAGTRYGEGDHFGVAARREGIRSNAGLPMPEMIVTQEGKWDVFWMDARLPDGTPTNPKVWPEWRLRDDEARDPVKHAAQVRNNPTSGGLNILTMADIENMFVDPKHVPYARLAILIVGDTAFKNPDNMSKGCSTVLEAWGLDRSGTGDVYYLEGYGSNKWLAPVYYDRILWLVQKWRRAGRNIIGVTDEKELFGKEGLSETHIRGKFNDHQIPCPPLYFFGRGGTKKISRILKAAEYWKDGKVKILRDAPGADHLIYQMTRILQLEGSPLDWADAAADVFQPEYYIPARMTQQATGAPAYMPFDDILKQRAVPEWLQDHPEHDEPYEVLQ